MREKCETVYLPLTQTKIYKEEERNNIAAVDVGLARPLPTTHQIILTTIHHKMILLTLEIEKYRFNC